MQPNPDEEDTQYSIVVFWKDTEGRMQHEEICGFTGPPPREGEEEEDPLYGRPDDFEGALSHIVIERSLVCLLYLQTSIKC